MRRAHFLKANHTSPLPLRLCWVDTEAANEHGLPEAGRQRLTFGVAIYEQYADSDSIHPNRVDKHRFECASGFWDWILSHAVSGRTIWVMAHNWNYDAGILDVSHELPKRGWVLKKYINGKPPLIVRWEKDGAYVTLVDTLNWFTSALAVVGKSVGLPKLTMPDSKASPALWDAYAWRDVEIIRAAFLSFRSFVREHDLGVMQPTLASQAFTAFRHRFMDTQILMHDNERALDLEREAYHGGRTEAFWNGETTGKLYKLDINSMYPAIMRTTPMSVRLKAYFPSYKPTWWEIAHGGYGMVARCKIETDQPAYGVVRDSRLIFPVGRFETVLSTPEILYAEAYGHIKEVGEWAYYEQEVIFSGFVDYFYEVRQRYKAEGNAAYEYLCKILMNSLYGKFGQSGRKWVETDEFELAEPGEMNFEHPDTGEIVQLRERLGRTQILLKGKESENSAPVIAAEICAAGRIQLWELIRKAGVENVFYLDTDSLVVNRTGFDNLQSAIHPVNLGYLKLEWEGDSAEFWAPKDYRLGSERKIKGIRHNATKLSDMTYEQDMFRSWDNNLKRGEDGFIDVIRQRKTLSRINTKAVVDGIGRNQAIKLWEW